MTDEVKRWAPRLEENIAGKPYKAGMMVAPDSGEYVKYDDHAREIEAKDEELRQLRESRAECLECGGDPAIAKIARRMGHRSDVAFAAVREAEAALAASREEVAELKEWQRSIRYNSGSAVGQACMTADRFAKKRAQDATPLRAKVDDNVLTGEQTPRHQTWCKPQRDGGCECGAEK